MSAMDATFQKNLGPSILTFGSTVLGHTDKNGVKVKIMPSIVEGVVGEAGMAVNAWLEKMPVEIDVILEQTDPIILAAAFPLFNKVTSTGGLSKLTGGDVSGKQITPAQLVIAPQIAANTPGYNFTVFKAYAAGAAEIDYVGSKSQGWAVKLKSLYDPTLGDGARVWAFGDTTITGDSVAPTATIAPTAGQTLAAPASIIWTFSENLDGRSVNAQNIKVIQWSGAAGTSTPTVLTPQAGSPVLANAGAATTVTWTPSSAFASGKIHTVVADGLMDQNGNLYAGGAFYSFFTTT
jgi:hypothetical protein